MVANNTGASSEPTTPPATMPPRYWVAKAAAHSLLASAYLKVPKNRMIGRKSSSSFMRGASVALPPGAAVVGLPRERHTKADGGGYGAFGLKSIDAELMQ